MVGARIVTTEYYFNGDNITDRHGRVVATQEPLRTDHTWFGLEDWYFCPDTGARIVNLGGTWYHFENAWNDYEDGTTDVDELEITATLILAILEGFIFSPRYRLPIHLGSFNVRMERPVRTIISEMFHDYWIPAHMVEHDRQRVGAGVVEEGTFPATVSVGTFEADFDDISTMSGDNWFIDQDVFFLLGTEDDPIDLTLDE